MTRKLKGKLKGKLTAESEGMAIILVADEKSRDVSCRDRKDNRDARGRDQISDMSPFAADQSFQK